MSDLTKNIYVKNFSYHLPIIKGGGGTKNLPRKKKRKILLRRRRKNDKENKIPIPFRTFLYKKHWYFVL